MKLPPVDPARLNEEWRADQDVLANLRENGDRPDIPRAVDVSFRGPPDALDDLADAAEELGFEVIETEPSDDGEPWLFLQRMQTADADAIKALTITCLQIEAMFGLEYDGWGCVAQTGLTH
ncbi:MAG: ribonuclease E inhibitor RraB [Sphingomonas sp.]|nr:ribonuclease E inhibitor RraB [Sphingomonas sp.]MDX3882879.1 ribonuclease E inhibitor RraB [Sphingomonas sp.]